MKCCAFCNMFFFHLKHKYYVNLNSKLQTDLFGISKSYQKCCTTIELVETSKMFDTTFTRLPWCTEYKRLKHEVWCEAILLSLVLLCKNIAIWYQNYNMSLLFPNMLSSLHYNNNMLVDETGVSEKSITLKWVIVYCLDQRIWNILNDIHLLTLWNLFNHYKIKFWRYDVSKMDHDFLNTLCNG